MIKFKWSFLILTILCALFVFYPQIDILISQIFFVDDINIADHGFIYSNNFIIQLIYKSIPWMALIVSISLITYITTLAFFSKNKQKVLHSPAVFLLLSLALGPGLSVNFILKEHFGRARPTQIETFGGNKKFSPAGYYTNQCKNNCSFSSGHASMGFYFTAIAWIVSPIYQILIFTIASIFGLLVGLGRIIQGGHFASDILFSFLIVIIINALSFKIWKKLIKIT